MSITADMEHLLNAAIEAVRRGMNIALHPPVELDVHTKANRNDLVTAVDKAIEADIASHLHAATGLPLLGGARLGPRSDRRHDELRGNPPRLCGVVGPV